MHKSLPQVILLNGTGSSGKTTIAKQLQEEIKIQYLNFSIDSILYSLPKSDLALMMKGEEITREGYDYSQLQKAYHSCIPSLLDSGCRIIIDNAWINKNVIDDLLNILSPYSTFIIGVYCDLNVANEREKERGDRAIGLAAYEYPLVHKHFNYDFTIDTSNNDPSNSCRLIMNALEEYNKALT